MFEIVTSMSLQRNVRQCLLSAAFESFTVRDSEKDVSWVTYNISHKYGETKGDTRLLSIHFEEDLIL